MIPQGCGVGAIRSLVYAVRVASLSDLIKVRSHRYLSGLMVGEPLVIKYGQPENHGIVID